MGNAQSLLAVNPDAAKRRTIIIALLLLWRARISMAIKAARGQEVEAAEGALTHIPTLLGHTGLIVYSHGALFEKIRSSVNVNKSQQMALILFILQLKGLIPELGHYLALSSSIYAQSKDPIVNDYIIPGVVSALLLNVFHEASDSYMPAWFGILFKIMGAPSPVLGGAAGPKKSLGEALNATEAVAHIKSAFPFALKLFLAIHLGIRPLLGLIRARMAPAGAKSPTADQQKPKSRQDAIIEYVKSAVPQAVRSAAFVSAAGLIGWFAGRWRVSDSPAVNLVARSALAQLILAASFLDDTDVGRGPIYNFATAEVLFAVLVLLGRSLNTPEHLSPTRLVALLHPALSVLGVCSPSLLGGLVARAL